MNAANYQELRWIIPILIGLQAVQMALCTMAFGIALEGPVLYWNLAVLGLFAAMLVRVFSHR